MIELDITFFIQLVNFLVSLAIINFFIVAPIRAVLQKRSSEKKALQEDVAMLEHRVQFVTQEYNDSIMATKKDADALFVSIEKDACAVAESLITKTQEEVAQQARIMRQNLAEDMQVIRNMLAKNTATYVEKVLGKVVR